MISPDQCKYCGEYHKTDAEDELCQKLEKAEAERDDLNADVEKARGYVSLLMQKNRGLMILGTEEKEIRDYLKANEEKG